MANYSQQSVSGGVRWILRLEGLCVLVGSCLLYSQFNFSWKLFAILFLVPDVSFLGYLAGSKLGAVSYNFAHSYIVPILAGVILIVLNNQGLFLYPLIWIAHIGFDRAMGYGLKYETSFGDTHLGKIGKWRKNASF
jgi:hypothetical protein